MASAHALTDHDEIRRWAEARRGQPACVKGTGRKGDVGMIRLDFPGYSGADRLQPISWDQWFRSFDENKLALLTQDKTANGRRSNFNKLVARKTAEGKQHSRRKKTRTAAARPRRTSATTAARSSRTGGRSRKSATPAKRKAAGARTRQSAKR